MRIVTWNCNLSFAKKFEHLEYIDADILIIQECENLQENYFPNSKYFWTGRIENKGLGVLVKNSNAYIDPSHNKNLINFLPIVSENIKILGVWAYNHRAMRFGKNANGNTIEAINFYEEWLKDDELPHIFGGDFNNSIIWDKPNHRNNFHNINAKLKNLGFSSAYHSKTRDHFGSEKNATFFHTKQKPKKYHIDYLYTKSVTAISAEVGSYEDWIELSDHTPLIVDI